MLFLKTKEERKILDKKITITDLNESENIVMKLDNFIVEDQNFSIFYEINEIMNGIPYSLVVYSKDNKELVQNYKNSHNNLSETDNQKIIQRIDNTNIEKLMDIYKKTFKLNITLDKKEINKIKDLEKLSFKKEEMIEVINNILPCDYKEIKNKETIKLITKNNKEKFIKQIKIKNRSQMKDTSILDIIIKTQNKSSKLYMKQVYMNHKVYAYFWIRNTSEEKLLNDFNKIKLNLMKNDYTIEEKNNINDLYYSLPIYNQKDINPKEYKYNVSKIPNYIIEKNNAKANLTFEDEIERIVPYSLCNNENFTISGIGGFGQSFLSKYIIFNYLLDNSRIRVINSRIRVINSYNYDRFTQIVGGKTYIINENYSFNLFNKYENFTKEKIENITDLIISLIDSPKDYAILKRPIEEAIQNVYSIFKEESNLKLIYELLLKNNKIKKQIEKLYDFGHENGKYFPLFNGDEELILDNDFIDFDMSRIEQDNIHKAINIYLNNLIRTDFEKLNKKNILIIDDKYIVMDKIFQNYLRRNLKMENTSFGFITREFYNMQNIETKFIMKHDFHHTENMEEEEKHMVSRFNHGEFILKKDNLNTLLKLKLTKTMRLIFEDKYNEIKELEKEAKLKEMDNLEYQIKKALKLAEWEL